jgi:threonine/homoserine/homoserine lactone efflux protein
VNSEIATILIMNGSILVVPGVNFLLLVKYSLLNRFKVGCYCALGITSAIMIHVILSMFGISLLLKTYPQVFDLIRYFGVFYLFYLGTRYWIVFFQNKQNVLDTVPVKADSSGAFVSGFLIDLFNPFISIFYLSLFALIHIENKSFFEFSSYFAVISIITFAWFCFVVRVFSYPFIKKLFQNKTRYIQAFSGAAMYYYSLKIIF